MAARHGEALTEIRRAVLDPRGDLSVEAREAILAGAGPDALQPYLEKVRRHAYRVRDEDVEALRGSGWSDDALFEATVAAAAGEGLRRFELALAALR